MIASLLLFFLIYLVLLLAAFALAATSVVGGISLIVSAPSALTIVLGGGIIGLGVMVFIFLVKFLFTPAGKGNPYRIQIYEEQHPRLFAFIRQLSIDTQTAMPRKVFVVPDVNAAVSYHSSFWSMIWPVRKNLEIGLGLVNTASLSELKMVLAHEFGHFSQSSMKLGSYVYTMNKAIYNMLYENEGYGNALTRWAKLSWIFTLMAHVTTWIVKGIQGILRLLYSLINRQYMGLSREMEFHADAVAISVAGSEAAISIMRRMELSAHCFMHCCQHISQTAEKDVCLQNLYEAQTALVNYLSRLNKLEMLNGLPVISDAYLSTVTNSRVQYKDQWASHPSDEEREARYKSAAIAAPFITTGAWELFDDAPGLQLEMTKHYYFVTFPEKNNIREFEPTATFIGNIESQHNLYLFPSVFADFYKNRPFADMSHVTCSTAIPNVPAAELYHNDVIQKIKRYFQNKNDLEILKAIAAKQIDSRHFEFDNQKHSRTEAVSLATALEKEITAQETWLNELDATVFHYHLRQAEAQGHGEKLRELHHTVILHQQMTAEMESQATKVIYQVQLLYNTGQMTVETLESLIRAIKEEEQQLKPLLRKMLDNTSIPKEVDETFAPDVQQFLTADHRYLHNLEVQQQEIIHLYRLTHRAVGNYTDVTVLHKKAYLEYVAELMQH